MFLLECTISYSRTVRIIFFMYQHASTLILGLTIPTAFGGSASKLNHYAKAGTCENVATGARRCALTPSDCEPTHIDGEKHINGEKWFSAYRLVQKDGQPCTCEKTRVNACFSNNCSGPNCGWTLADVHDGANTGFRCAANSASCALSKGEVFGQLEDDTLAEGAQCGCNALMKPGEQESSDKLSVGNQRATLYGACYKDSDNVFCAYSPDDCGDDGYSWLDPLSASDILGYDCTCAGESDFVVFCLRPSSLLSTHSIHLQTLTLEVALEASWASCVLYQNMIALGILTIRQ